MKLFFQIIQFIIYSLTIVIISKALLVPIIRNLAKTLNLNSKAIGNLTGIATSMPEFLSVSFSALIGLIDTSIYNIISSNFINLFLYIVSILLNKNVDKLKNKALKSDFIICILTIIIPLVILKINIEINLSVIPLLILLFLLFYTINKSSHNLYLKKYEEEVKNKNIDIRKNEQIFSVLKYSIYLILTGISLYIFGNLLSKVINNLSILYNIPQILLGITLGFVTSIPEVITFFESQKYYNNKENKKMNGIIETTNNLLTSNLMNLCIVQSVGILILLIV